MEGYVVKGVYPGWNGNKNISGIVNNTVYLSSDKALEGLEECKTNHPFDYDDYILEPIKVIP